MPKMLVSLLLLIALFAVMYFLMIHPQQKQQKQLMDMRNTMEVGDEVVTIGGVKGTIVSVADNSVILETSSRKTRLEFARNAIASNVRASKVTENKKEDNEVK